MVETLTSMPGEGLENYPGHGDMIEVVMTENRPQNYEWEVMFGLGSHATPPDLSRFGGSGSPGLSFRYQSSAGDNIFDVIDLADGTSRTASNSAGVTILEGYHIDTYGYDGGFEYANWQDVFLRFQIEWVQAENGPDGVRVTYDILDYVAGSPAVVEPVMIPSGVHFETTAHQGNSGFGWLAQAPSVDFPSANHLLTDVALEDTGGAVYTDSPVDEFLNGGIQPS